METFTSLDITTRSQTPTLWVFGCSHSYGVGLRPGEKNYGALLADQLDMPLKLVAKPGSSTQFSLRHLINADIQADDIVVWQLSTAERCSYRRGELVNEIMIATQPPGSIFLDFFTDDQIFFHHVSLLNMGAMYLRAKKVNFAFISIFSGLKTTELLHTEYQKYPEYCNTNNYEVDKGTDRLHTGPRSHQNISNSLYNHIQSNL